MPFSSGTYSLPSGNPVVTGTTISSTTTNTTNSDIATALSSCILKDGTQTVTANIPMASHKITGLAAPTTAGDALAYGSPINTTAITGITTPLSAAQGGTGVATSTGTGSAVLNTSPTLTTPTIDSAQVPTISGTAPLYMCRAWVNFNGSGTVAIRASGNVSSITDNGVGDYTVNFTTAMPDANYSLSGSASRATIVEALSIAINNTTAPTTAAVRMRTDQNGFAVDSNYACISIFR